MKKITEHKVEKQTEINEVDVLKEQLSKLQQELQQKDECIALALKSKQRTESDQLDQLFDALAKAQGEMKVATKSRANSHFKSEYATIDDIVRASRPALTKHGLSIMQFVKNGQTAPIFCTRLCHKSGQFIESQMNFLQDRPGLQGFGSASTYLRRYNYVMMACVALLDDELDDDGEADRKALEASRKEAEAKAVKKITREQLDILQTDINGDEELLQRLLDGYKIHKLAELPYDKFNECLRGVRKNNEIKNSK